MGGITQVRESHRDTRGLPLLETFFQDVQYATRTLRKNIAFTAVAVLTLAVGIGVNTAIFTTYNAVLLRPIQAREPSHLVQISRATGDEFFSYPDYAYYRDNSRTLSGLIAMTFKTFSMSNVAAPIQVRHGAIADAVGFQVPQQLSGSAEEALPGGGFRQLF